LEWLVLDRAAAINQVEEANGAGAEVADAIVNHARFLNQVEFLTSTVFEGDWLLFMLA